MKKFIPIYEVTSKNVEGKTPDEFVPVVEVKRKDRTMDWPMVKQTTIDAMQFLLQDGQPANFKIMMTNKCNLSCTYCFQQHNKEMILWTEESLKFYFDAFCDVDTSHCWNTQKTWDWFGGEPLIYKQKILNFMRHNKEKIQSTTDIDYSITTNATLLTEDFTEEFLKYNGAYIIVSLDTVFLDVDNRNHTGKSMTQVLSALGGIAKHAGPYNTSVTLTVSPDQRKSIENAFEVMYRVGVRNFLVNPLIYNKHEMADWTIETMQELRDIVLSFADKYKDAVMEFGAEVAPKNTINCLTGGKVFGIDGSGDVTGCFFFSNDKEKHGDIVLANVFSGLTNPNYEEIAKQDSQFYTSDEQCKTCDLWDMCYVCPAGVYDTSGGTHYFKSNGSCQEVVRCHVQVKEQMEAVNIPFREEKIQEYQNIQNINKQLSEIHFTNLVFDTKPHYLKLINKQLAAVLQSDEFITEANRSLNHNEFFKQAIERFSFRIVEDEEGFTMDEPEYGCIFNISRFNMQLRTFDDLLAQVIHTSLHEWCEVAWINTPTPKQTFNAIELDVLEEIYGQALIYNIAPRLYHLFPDNLRQYFEFVNSDDETKLIFDQVFNLMVPQDAKVVDPSMEATLQWLYIQDPTEPQTFWKYIAVCESLLSKTDLRKLLQNYYDLLGSKIEWA